MGVGIVAGRKGKLRGVGRELGNGVLNAGSGEGQHHHAVQLIADVLGVDGHGVVLLFGDGDDPHGLWVVGIVGFHIDNPLRLDFFRQFPGGGVHQGGFIHPIALFGGGAGNGVGEGPHGGDLLRRFSRCVQYRDHGATHLGSTVKAIFLVCRALSTKETVLTPSAKEGNSSGKPQTPNRFVGTGLSS